MASVISVADLSGPEYDWLALCEVEPRLDELEEIVAHYSEINQASQATHCEIEFYLDWLYPRLVKIVGFERRSDPTVPAWFTTSAAFDTARFHLQVVSGECCNCTERRVHDLRTSRAPIAR